MRGACPLQVMSRPVSELKTRPEEGCYIHGLFLEGARWDPAAFQLAESRPKELYTEMAAIWLLPVPNRVVRNHDFYLCPIYKTLTRAGTEARAGSLHPGWGPAQGKGVYGLALLRRLGWDRARSPVGRVVTEDKAQRAGRGSPRAHYPP